MKLSVAVCATAVLFTLFAECSQETNQVISVEIGDGYVIERLATGDERPVVGSDISVDEDGIVTSNEIVSDLPVLPGAETATNAVAVALLRMLQLSAIDNFDSKDENGVPCTTETVVPTWTWDGFLGKDEVNGWTRAAKKACFDWYLNFMATNACAITDAQTNLSAIAIGQCEDLSYTNAWQSLMGIAKNPHSPWRDHAGVLAIELAPDTGSISSLGLDAYTNSIALAENARGNVVSAYFDRLASQSSPIPPACLDEIIKYRSRECEAAMSLDRLLSTKIPGYEVSSNRLSAAVSILNNPDSWEFQNAYFINVTNRLMNATQPLQEVEVLRGL